MTAEKTIFINIRPAKESLTKGIVTLFIIGKVFACLHRIIVRVPSKSSMNHLHHRERDIVIMYYCCIKVFSFCFIYFYFFSMYESEALNLFHWETYFLIINLIIRQNLGRDTPDTDLDLLQLQQSYQ